MIDNNYCYNARNFKDNNLRGLSQEIVQTVYNVCRILYDGWDTTESGTKRKFAELINFFEKQNREKVFADIFTIGKEQLEEVPILVFQIATYRFYKEHLPKIMETITKSDWKNSKKLWNSYSLLENVNLEKWEKPFWLWASGQRLKSGFYSGFVYRARVEIYDGEEKKYEQQTIEEIIRLAMKHNEVIEQITQIKKKYMPYSKRAEKLNCASKQYSEEQLKGYMDAVQSAKKMLDVLEINLKGELATSDIVEVEKIVPTLKEQMEELTGTVNDMFQYID